jgi:hypothetical protein
MNILGLDPGQTSGWCLYDATERRVLDAGTFPDFQLACICTSDTVAVIERPRAYGPTRPQVVECAYIAGRLFAGIKSVVPDAHEMDRREVKQILTAAVQRDVVVTDDASAWAALKLLHGPDCDKRGGPLHGVKSHARAALAVAVAFALREAAGVKS